VDFLPPVVATLLADIGEFTAKFGEAEAKLTGFEAAQNRMAAAGKVAMAGLALGVAAVGYESVKMASNFDQAMELIHTQAGASQAEVEVLKQKVLDLAPTVGMGPEALATGLYHVESAGFRGQVAMDILAAAAKDAAIGMGDMEAVTQALIGTMASGIGGIKDAADAAAYLNQIVGIGDMRMDKLAAAISTGILPSFRSAGLQMNDFGAALATITDNATPADEAATRLRMTVSLMSAPSHAATVALQSIGIGSTQLADDLRKPDGLLVAVMDLKNHLEESGKTASEQNQVIQKAFGGGKTSGAILTLLEESDRLKDKYAELGTTASRTATFQDAWAAQQQQFSQQVHQLTAEAQKLGIELGNFLIPKIQELAGWLTRHTEVVKIAALVIGGILVAAMVAFTASVVASTVALLANPVTWIILAIVAAVALLSVGIYELVKHWSTVWGFIKRIAEDVWHWLVDAWNVTIHGLSTAVEAVYRDVIRPIVRFFANDLLHPVLVVLRVLETAWNVTWHVLSTVAGFFYGFFSVIVGDIVKVVTAVLMPVVHYLEDQWNMVWHGLTAIAQWAWDNVIKPVFGFIYTVGIKPLVVAATWLASQWDTIWGFIRAVFEAWWLVVKVVFKAVYDYGIKPLWDAMQAFTNFWVGVWKTIGDALQWVYDHTLKPIFDVVKTGLGDISKLISAGSQGGGALAHFLGFAEGGPVPGPAGAPQLAVVHGGEFVLSRDMLTALRSSGGRSPIPSVTAVGQGTPSGAVVVQANLYLDGKQIYRAVIPVAQQAKRRTGSTGLS